MFTPQQIEQIAFGTATFGGYNKNDVDEFLEPLTEDYITLYKENALLKSKMKVLVTKLEEYRNNEASMKEAMVNAQRACDKMVKEAEEKCAAMLGEANNTAAENIKNTDALVAAENARVEEAKRTADAKIQEIQDQIRACLQALDRIREANAPAAVQTQVTETQTQQEASDEEKKEESTSGTDDVANEISASLQALVGTTEETQPKAEPNHPVSDTTGKFANLKFGRNYDPNNNN